MRKSKFMEEQVRMDLDEYEARFARTINRTPEKVLREITRAMSRLSPAYASPIRRKMLANWGRWWRIHAAYRAGKWRLLREECGAAITSRSRYFRDRPGLYALCARASLHLNHRDEARHWTARGLRLVAGTNSPWSGALLAWWLKAGGKRPSAGILSVARNEARQRRFQGPIIDTRDIRALLRWMQASGRR